MSTSKPNQKYFYTDNWNGNKLYFANLRDAKKSASTCTGESVAIIEIATNKIIHVKASGHCPA